MNRAHNAYEAQTCLEEATQYFDNISIDLIYGIPTMSVQKWNDNLEMAFKFGINHISAYALTVEPKTPLDAFIKKEIYPPMNEDMALSHFNHLIKRADQEGFVHYEISNFGKPNYFSKHNTIYWMGKTYLGIGPSAHSFDGQNRSWNVSNNTKYIQTLQKGILPSTKEILSNNDHFNEHVMIGLRTIWGISLNAIEKKFGVDYRDHLKLQIKKFVSEGLLVTNSSQNDEVLKATNKGKFLIDGIASELFIVE
jgi:oxygen-independent coproporphyrinogen-3 oxidase